MDQIIPVILHKKEIDYLWELKRFWKNNYLSSMETSDQPYKLLRAPHMTLIEVNLNW
jgi:hypothetical protein